MSRAEKGDKIRGERTRSQTPCPELGTPLVYGDAIRAGFSTERIFNLSGIDPWFVENIRQIINKEEELIAESHLLSQGGEAFSDLLRDAKQYGFSDKRLAVLWKSEESTIRQKRIKYGVRPVFKRVDTCGAEFQAFTPYFYSTYEQECEAQPTDRKRSLFLVADPTVSGGD